MRTIFIADAHLVSPTATNYSLLLRFLDELNGEVDTLYILGDLFDFWLGFPSNPYPQYDAILDALERLVVSGCKLVYFEGNHDFHLGTIFSHRLKAKIQTGPTTEIVQGKKLYVCHGDQINKKDRLYRLMRFLLRTRLVAACIKYFPPALAFSVRERLQSRSRASYNLKASRWDYRKIIMDFAHSLQKQGYDGLITGHFHLAINEDLPETDFSVLSLGDWMAQFTYGEMRDGKLSLINYSPDSSIP